MISFVINSQDSDILHVHFPKWFDCFLRVFFSRLKRSLVLILFFFVIFFFCYFFLLLFQIEGLGDRWRMIFYINSLEGEPNSGVSWVEFTRRGRGDVRQFITTQSLSKTNETEKRQLIQRKSHFFCWNLQTIFQCFKEKLNTINKTVKRKKK